MIKKIVNYFPLLFLLGTIALGSCSSNLTNEDTYTEWKAENEDYFSKAYASGDYHKLNIPINRGGGTVLYKELKKGDVNAKSPYYTSTVLVHYKGKLINGTVFDKSFLGGNGPDKNKPTEGEWATWEDSPARFGVNNVIKGWTEILQIMRIGDKFEIVIPWKLGYGAVASGSYILPYSALIFEVELIDIPVL